MPFCDDDTSKSVVPIFYALCLLPGQEQARTREIIDTEALAMEVDEILKQELEGLNADLHQDCMCDDLIQVQVLHPATQVP